MEFNLEVVKKNFIRRGFHTIVCHNRQEARRFILENFPVNHDTLIGMGNSSTLDALGIKNIWNKQTPTLYQHTPGSGENETKQALLADIYLTSANAISCDGYIVNIDGTGNRTAATCYGPKQVIYAIGKNKIAASLEEAIKRARNIAAVKNAKRYNRKTPCTITGKCEDCLSPDCICRVMTIHRQQPYGLKITLILIDEELGF